MKKTAALFISNLLLFSFSASSQELDKSKDYIVSTIAFYNFENLFDTIVDPDTTKILQEDFTPHSGKNWNSKRYYEKLDNMAFVVAQLGTEVNPEGPAILGVAEVENRLVLEDFSKQEKVKKSNYQIVHYDSPDRRGIDVALLYNPKYFKVESSCTYTVKDLPDNETFITRDQLLVTGKLHGDRVHIIVAHWPSRRGGQKRSAPRRAEAAKVGKSIVDSILVAEPNAKIFYMGDLNDDPVSPSVKKVLHSVGKKAKVEAGDLYNPWQSYYSKGIGTLSYNGTWNLFDQILVSPELIKTDYTSYRYYAAKVFNKDFLKQHTGKYKGSPKRTYGGAEYLGGYSDHFPVYIFVIKEK